MVIELDIFESLKPFVKSFINVQIFPLVLLQVMRQIYGEDLVLRGEYDQMSVQFDYFLNFGCVRSCYLWFLGELVDIYGSVLVEDQLLCFFTVEVEVDVGFWA